MRQVIEGFPRITLDPSVMTGRLCTRGMRVTIGMILGHLSGGATIEELSSDFPSLERDDIMEALRYGSSPASGGEAGLGRAA